MRYRVTVTYMAHDPMTGRSQSGRETVTVECDEPNPETARQWAIDRVFDREPMGYRIREVQVLKVQEVAA